VLEIKAEKKGDVKVRLVLEVPPDVVEPIGPGVGVPGVPGIPMPVVPGLPAAVAAKDTYGISLLDSRGRKFHPVAASSKQAVVNGNAVKEYTLTFQPQVGQGKAAKLVYEAARVATVEVPFALADVPLP
jgi:siroheme synthase